MSLPFRIRVQSIEQIRVLSIQRHKTQDSGVVVEKIPAFLLLWTKDVWFCVVHTWHIAWLALASPP